MGRPLSSHFIRFFLLVFLHVLNYFQSSAQVCEYTTANAHSHNDYEKALPFWDAWKYGFGSIEVDVFLHEGKLIVAHDSSQLQRRWTLDSLYLKPLQQCMTSNNGTVFAMSNQVLQLMIDIKSDAIATMQEIVGIIEGYPLLIRTSSLRIVVSGARPKPYHFSKYPKWMYFDGDFDQKYTTEQLSQVALFSGNFKKFSTWNGKGKLPESENDSILESIKQAHRLKKKVRFWNAPDNLNSWYVLQELGVDFVNTDHIPEISQFFNTQKAREFASRQRHKVYQPKWRNDGKNKQVKNVILIIGDGAGLSQWHAAYTANKGALNVFNMRYTGLSKTASFDHYITDSAPGATAFSSGKKTNNRSVGVNPNGAALRLLPEILSRRGIKTGIITTGDLRDATPAAFYAHQVERSDFEKIFKDLLVCPISLIIGAVRMSKADSARLSGSKFQLTSSLTDLPLLSKTQLIIGDSLAGLPVNKREDWLQRAIDHSIKRLSKNDNGFFLVVQGAQVDYGGHANRLPYVVSEVMDLDASIGKAMAFADLNGETLVVVTGDHETGGLTLTAGSIGKGEVKGQFSTDDHTAVPVPVFAYGPWAHVFTGVYENTAIFEKIRCAFFMNRNGIN